MAGKTGFRAYPRHLPRPDGRGIVQCDASGFLRKPERIVHDVRQGDVAEEFADFTPGFGTNHPQDVVQLPPLDDPQPVEKTSPQSRIVSKADRGYTSDVELEKLIREGKA